VDEANEAIIANGNFIKVIYARPAGRGGLHRLRHQDAILIDNTGKLKDDVGLAVT
jgi:glyceraldehyde 3-phosphate dehydrogenase